MIGDSTKIGLFGKLPCAGDFLRRGLRAETIASFDGWLQDRLADTRGGWSALDAPAWRFVAAPGVFAPTAIVGLMAASFDRVGRDFPIVLAIETDWGEPGPHDLELDWFDRADRGLRSAIDGNGDLGEVDLLLADLRTVCDEASIWHVLEIAPMSSYWWLAGDLENLQTLPSAPDAAAFVGLMAAWRPTADHATLPDDASPMQPSGLREPRS